MFDGYGNSIGTKTMTPTRVQSITLGDACVYNTVFPMQVQDSRPAIVMNPLYHRL